MTAGISGGHSPGYVAGIGSAAWQLLTRLVRAPSHSRRAEARRALARRWLGLSVLTAVAIGLLMVAVDVATIKLMPPRGTASLWPLRIFTDFGKSTYVLWALAGVLLAPISGVHPAMGTDILTASFVVVVIGGLGSFWGVVWAALIVGVVHGLTVYFFPPAAEASMYLLMVLVLLFRPRGLFGERIQRFE